MLTVISCYIAAEVESINNIHMGQSIKSGPSKICGRQPFKKFEGMWSA